MPFKSELQGKIIVYKGNTSDNSTFNLCNNLCRYYEFFLMYFNGLVISIQMTTCALNYEFLNIPQLKCHFNLKADLNGQFEGKVHK